MTRDYEQSGHSPTVPTVIQERVMGRLPFVNGGYFGAIGRVSNYTAMPPILALQLVGSVTCRARKVADTSVGFGNGQVVGGASKAV